MQVKARRVDEAVLHRYTSGRMMGYLLAHLGEGMQQLLQSIVRLQMGEVQTVRSQFAKQQIVVRSSPDQ